MEKAHQGHTVPLMLCGGGYLPSWNSTAQTDSAAGTAFHRRCRIGAVRHYGCCWDSTPGTALRGRCCRDGAAGTALEGQHWKDGAAGTALQPDVESVFSRATWGLVVRCERQIAFLLRFYGCPGPLDHGLFTTLLK